VLLRNGSGGVTRLQSVLRPIERIAVRHRDRYVLVKVSDIDVIEVAANYVDIHVRDRSYLLQHDRQSRAETRSAPVYPQPSLDHRQRRSRRGDPLRCAWRLRSHPHHRQGGEDDAQYQRPAAG
jgi:hypothetical protein